MPSFIMYLLSFMYCKAKLIGIVPMYWPNKAGSFFSLSYNVHFLWCTEWSCIGRWCTASREKNPWTKSGNYCRETANLDHIAYCCKVHRCYNILVQEYLFIIYLSISHSYIWLPLFPSPSASVSLSYSPFLSPSKLWQTKIIQKGEAFEMRSTANDLCISLFETLWPHVMCINECVLHSTWWPQVLCWSSSFAAGPYWLLPL